MSDDDTDFDLEKSAAHFLDARHHFTNNTSTSSLSTPPHPVFFSLLLPFSHCKLTHSTIRFALARPQVQPSDLLKHNGNGDILTLIFLTIKYTFTTQESNSNIFRAFNELVSLVRSQIQPDAGGYVLTVSETIN